ncbi:hypothetical protein ACU4GD_28565 [Cupriavidus basilensis]
MESIIASSAALGAVIGLILALTGAGGAILAVPLLLFIPHLTRRGGRARWHPLPSACLRLSALLSGCAQASSVTGPPH